MTWCEMIGSHLVEDMTRGVTSSQEDLRIVCVCVGGGIGFLGLIQCSQFLSRLRCWIWGNQFLCCVSVNILRPFLLCFGKFGLSFYIFTPYIISQQCFCRFFLWLKNSVVM